MLKRRVKAELNQKGWFFINFIAKGQDAYFDCYLKVNVQCYLARILGLWGIVYSALSYQPDIPYSRRRIFQRGIFFGPIINLFGDFAYFPDLNAL